MRTIGLALLVSVAVFLACGLGMVFAQAKALESEVVTVTGENYCLLGSLAKAETPIPALVTLNALRVTTAKGADGKVIPELSGKTLHYLPTKTAEPLMLGGKMAGAEVTVTGKLFKAENALLLQHFEVDENFSEVVKPPSGVTGVQRL